MGGGRAKPILVVELSALRARSASMWADCAAVGGAVGFAGALTRWWLTLMRPDLLAWAGWGTGVGGTIGLVLYAAAA